jgi:type IV pilus assembly protein PilC
LATLKINTNKKNKPSEKSQNTVLDFLNRDFKLFNKKLNDKKKEHFYSELNILLSAGIDIKTSLELIVEQETDKNAKELFSKIKEDVIRGQSLSATLENSPMFSLYESYSIRIGEESGKLDEVLKELGLFYAKKIKLTRQIISALSYPIIVLLVAGGTIAFLLNFVVPMFSDVFKRFSSELPALTKLVIKFSQSSSYVFYPLIIIIIFLLVLIFTQKKKLWFRKISSYALINFPIIGPMIRKIYMARFCLSMNLLLGAKTPLLKSLQLAKNMVNFYPIELSIESSEKEILKGASLNKSLSKHAIYDKRMISLIKVAEEVNQLDIIFSKLSQQYSDEVDHQTSILSSLIEPVMIIGLGILVSIILIAMYLPLFQLSSSFN